jgi:hypothetical protein
MNQGGLAGYPPSPYIVNLIELQNTINNASGLTTTQALSNAVADIQLMVDFQRKQVNTNFLASYDSDSITVLSNMNFSNASLTVNGTTVSGSGGSAGSSLISGNTSITLASVSSPAIAFTIQNRPIFTFSQSTNATYYDPSGIGTQFWISGATLLADNVTFGGASMGAVDGKFLRATDTAGKGVWSYVSSIEAGTTRVSARSTDHSIRCFNNSIENIRLSMSTLTVNPYSFFTSSIYCYSDMYATNFNLISDWNLKHNIQALDTAASDSILDQLQGVRFEWNRNNVPDIGMIAQTVQQALPEAVSESGEGLAISYNKIIPVLVESVKGLKQRVTFLEKEITELKSRLA